MNFFRKNLFGLAVVSFLALGSVLSAQAFHHHEALESHSDCSFCSWQQTGSQAASIPVPPALLLQTCFFVLLFTFKPFHFSTVFHSFSGRAPPQNLL
jgi:hypothetical protein